MFINDKKSLKTTVVDCYSNKGKIYAILENTIFYPTGGGQNNDLGSIGDAKVLDVFYFENNIVHLIDNEISGEVECTLDFERRYNNSLLHTAQHLFSAVVECTGIETHSFSMKDDSFSIDVLKALSKDELNVFENQINELIRSGRSVEIRNYDESMDSEVDVSHLENKDEIKLVIIEDLDKNPCGGTHVDNISEIKYFKIVRWKYNNDSVRITAYISDKAIEYVNRYFDNYNQVIKIINQQEENAVEYIENKLKELKKLQKEYKKLSKKVENV